MAGRHVPLSGRPALRAEQRVVGGGDPGEHPDAAGLAVGRGERVEPGAGQPGVLQRLPGDLEEEPLLRVDVGGLVGGQTEERGVEGVHAVQEVALGDHAAAVAPPVGGQVADGVLADHQVVPEGVETVGARVTPADADDGEHVVARVRVRVRVRGPGRCGPDGRGRRARQRRTRRRPGLRPRARTVRRVLLPVRTVPTGRVVRRAPPSTWRRGRRRRRGPAGTASDGAGGRRVRRGRAGRRASRDRWARSGCSVSRRGCGSSPSPAPGPPATCRAPRRTGRARGSRRPCGRPGRAALRRRPRRRPPRWPLR